jgi:hypothetical protein
MTMKSRNYQPSRLQILYLVIFFILFSFIVIAPSLINGPLYLAKKIIIEEETIEGALLFILFLLSIWIFNLYKNEVGKHKELIITINHDKKKVEERLSVSDQYIGSLNVQIQEIYSIFNNINKYPETKSDLKKTFAFFGERVLGIVNTNWVLFRIIDNNTQRTICESFETRQGYSTDYPHVSNKLILEKQPILHHTSIISNPQNLDIFASCIIPINSLSNEQRIFIQAIINEITKLFVILNSTYYKKEPKIFNGNSTEKKKV